MNAKTLSRSDCFSQIGCASRPDDTYVLSVVFVHVVPSLAIVLPGLYSLTLIFTRHVFF